MFLRNLALCCAPFLSSARRCCATGKSQIIRRNTRTLKRHTNERSQNTNARSITETLTLNSPLSFFFFFFFFTKKSQDVLYLKPWAVGDVMDSRRPAHQQPDPFLAHVIFTSFLSSASPPARRDRSPRRETGEDGEPEEPNNRACLPAKLSMRSLLPRGPWHLPTFPATSDDTIAEA